MFLYCIIYPRDKIEIPLPPPPSPPPYSLSKYRQAGTGCCTQPCGFANHMVDGFSRDVLPSHVFLLYVHLCCFLQSMDKRNRPYISWDNFSVYSTLGTFRLLRKWFGSRLGYVMPLSPADDRPDSSFCCSFHRLLWLTAWVTPPWVRSVGFPMAKWRRRSGPRFCWWASRASATPWTAST